MYQWVSDVNVHAGQFSQRKDKHQRKEWEENINDVIGQLSYWTIFSIIKKGEYKKIGSILPSYVLQISLLINDQKRAAYEIEELGGVSFTSDFDSSTRPLSSESS